MLTMYILCTFFDVVVVLDLNILEHIQQHHYLTIKFQALELLIHKS